MYSLIVCTTTYYTANVSLAVHARGVSVTVILIVYCEKSHKCAIHLGPHNTNLAYINLTILNSNNI